MSGVQQRKAAQKGKPAPEKSKGAGAPSKSNTAKDDSKERGKIVPAITILAGHRTPLAVMFLMRNVAAMVSMVADCDETFNYWEAAHFLAFGHGFQTWEYSPVYALRSYALLSPYAFAARTFALVEGKATAFFFIRAFQCWASFFFETFLVLAISRRFGAELARTTAWFLALAPGMFVQSVAFLPSSISMLMVCLAWASWLSGQFYSAIVVGAFAAVVVWIPVGALFVPLGLHAMQARGVVRSVGCAIAAFGGWAVMDTLVNSRYYGYTVSPVVQFAKYNFFGGKDRGTHLYGVEPWHFYIQNGFLNLNVILLVALVLPLVVVLGTLLLSFGRAKELWSALGYSSAAFVWLAIFSYLPHKEERFLAPVYPILCFAAAAAVHGASESLLVVCRAIPWVFGVPLGAICRRARSLVLVACIGLSLSRIAALQTGYAAPLKIYSALSNELSSRRADGHRGPLRVCVGVEWYRFTSSFFLPHRDDHLSYVRFGSTGLLPAEWNATLGTSGVPPNMNDLNLEDPSRYIDPKTCDYLVDLEVGEGKGDLPWLRQQSWDTVAEAPFLDAGASPQPWRTFYVPGLSDKKNVYAPYRLLKAK